MVSTETLGGLRDTYQWGAQISFYVYGKRFDRRDVQDAAALLLGGYRRKHNPIDAPQKCGERFAGARRGQDQRGFTAPDGRPAGDLRARGRGKNSGEPIAHGGMEKLQSVGRWFGGRGFTLFGHGAGLKILSRGSALDACGLSSYAMTIIRIAFRAVERWEGGEMP